MSRPENRLLSRIKKLSPEDKRYYFGVVPFVTLAGLAWNIGWIAAGKPLVAGLGDAGVLWLYAISSLQQR